MPTMNSIMMTIYGKMLHFIIKLCLYKLKIIYFKRYVGCKYYGKDFKKHIDANLIECGIEIGVPNVGYKYTVIRDAVLHIVTNGEGVFIYNGKAHTLKRR